MPLLVTNAQATMIQFALEWLASALFLGFCLYVRYGVGQAVTDPFIDEIFHLRQCQKYLDYHFYEWDNKITTPPGLYVLGFAYSKVLQWLTNSELDTYQVLRSVNLVGGLLVLPIITALFKTSNRNQFWSINIISQPLLFTYYFLFYTDIWSTILILASLALVVNKPHTYVSAYGSAFLSFLSLWFRQTNIIWSAFILSVLIDRSIISTRTAHLNHVQRMCKFIFQLVKSWINAMPFMINFVLFIVFLKINGGITFGDKENHTIQLHLVQVFYCFVFIVLFTWPVWLNQRFVSDYVKFSILHNYGINLILNGLSLLVIKYIIDNFTIVHPFLLADNRHYTFYIFKKLISHKYSKFISVPLYHFSTYTIIKALSESRKIGLSVITIITYVASILLTIVPSPLFEPRYYIVPLIVFRLFIQPASKQRHILEFLWLNAINIVTTTVFFKHEFTWDSEPGVQRIIW